MISARLVDTAMHLRFLLERRWIPYAKWRGTVLAQLPRPGAVGLLLQHAITATTWQERQVRLADALGLLHTVQRDVGLEIRSPAVVPFWGRPYLHPNEGISKVLIDAIDDEEVRRLPMGVGSIEQWCDNVDVLVDVARRRRAVGLAC